MREFLLTKMNLLNVLYLAKVLFVCTLVSEKSKTNCYYFCGMIKYYAISFVCTFILYACNNNPTTNNQANYIEALQQKAKNNPNDVQLQYEITNSLDSAGNYSAALQSINALIINDSLNNMYWFTKGQVQEHLKDTVGAILSYHRSIRVYPSPDVMLSLANLYAESKNEASLTLCNNIMQLKLGKLYDAHSRFISGVYFSRTSNFNKAILLFDE